MLERRIAVTYLDRVLDFLESIADGVGLMYDLEDRIAHRGLMQQIVYRHVGQALFEYGAGKRCGQWVGGNVFSGLSRALFEGRT